MAWLARAVQSSIGGKLLVALTGLMMVGFLVAHLSGNLLFFAGPQAMSDYAQGLRHFPMLLWVARLGLIFAAVAHIGLAVKLNLTNRAARPTPYVQKHYKKATPQSRSMVLTGLLILAYILFHLAHFTFRATSAEIGALGPWDVYPMIVLSFSNPLVAGTYIIAMALLGVHLAHGISSVFQTLGIRQSKYDRLLGLVGPAIGAALALGFISIPVSVLTGIMK